MIEDYYPTPNDLISKMFEGIKFSETASILEPSAGKGDICDALKRRLDSQYNRRSNIIDVIEINPDLQATLRGKGYNLIQDDFLTFQTNKPYDLIIANFPFSDGEHHLAKAISMIERNGGQLVCLVNAETLRNPHTNGRQMVRCKLEDLEATIEFLPGEFKTAERRSDVEVALIRIKHERPAVAPLILDELKRAEAATAGTQEREQIIEKDFINAMVARFNLECKVGIRLIEEYFVLKPYILDALPQKDKDSYGRPIIVLKVNDKDRGDSVNAYIDEYLPSVRGKYWTVLVNDPRYTGQYTENILQDLREKLTELRNCDFNRFNIEQLGKDLAGRLNKGVEKAILDLFDTFSRGHSWHEQQDNGNIHYYNGWKTNKAWKVNKKVIIPMHGFSAYSKSLDYRCKERLRDMIKVFNYLSADKASEHLLPGLQYGNDIHAGDVNDFRYFSTKFYLKGTCHITFHDQDLLDKFNIFGSQRKGWLPPGYGKKPFDEMDREEKETIDTFQGRAKYDEVIRNPEKYIVDDAAAGVLFQLKMKNGK